MKEEEGREEKERGGGGGGEEEELKLYALYPGLKESNKQRRRLRVLRASHS